MEYWARALDKLLAQSWLGPRTIEGSKEAHCGVHQLCWDWELGRPDSGVDKAVHVSVLLWDQRTSLSFEYVDWVWRPFFIHLFCFPFAPLPARANHQCPVEEDEERGLRKKVHQTPLTNVILVRRQMRAVGQPIHLFPLVCPLKGDSWLQCSPPSWHP